MPTRMCHAVMLICSSFLRQSFHLFLIHDFNQAVEIKIFILKFVQWKIKFFLAMVD